MPSRNVVKHYDVDSVYHAYNRGVEKRTIFMDQGDYLYFEYLLERHLGPRQMIDSAGRNIPNFSEEVELLAYCLMPNHFHLLLHQSEIDGVSRLMKSVSNAYTAYFNKKYDRVGSLFQGVFKAAHVTDDVYYQHVSRYIHLNAMDVGNAFTYPYSSLGDYLGQQRHWVKPGRVLDLFGSKDGYSAFVRDYMSNKRMLDQIKHQLADH